MIHKSLCLNELNIYYATSFANGSFIRFKTLFFGFLCAISCSKPDNVTEIDEELQVYVDRFYAEARLRGRNLENIDLIATFTDEIILDGNSFCGYGRGDINGRGQASIEIVSSEECWGAKSDMERENFIFHELGHALLRRPHVNTQLPNGLYETMMCGGYRTCNNYLAYNEFQDYKRGYYLDELFSKAPSELPEWAFPKQSETIIFTENFENDTMLIIDSLAVGGDGDSFSLDGNDIIEGNSLIVQSNGEVVSFPIRLELQNPEDCVDIVLKVDALPEIENSTGVYLALQANYIGVDNKRIPLQEQTMALSDFSSLSKQSIRLGCIAEETDEIIAFIFFDPGTIGRAYFDNISVSVFN